MGGSSRLLLLGAAGAAVAAFGGWRYTRAYSLPAHLAGHPVVYRPDLLPASAAAQLMELAKEMKDFPTNSADTLFYDALHDNIGEAMPKGADGKCAHALMVPSVKDKNLCVMPGRVDVGRHYIATGGVEGLKESYDILLSRVLSFGRYMFEPNKYPIVANLFASSEFQELAAAVCPANQRVLDPFQFNFIAQVPGQTVAAHIDAPYFWGATRFQFPQWLLAAMVFSGLFQDQFVNQVQVVAYFHQWSDVNSTRGGDFLYWNTSNPVPFHVPPKPLSASSVDGSKTVHAAAVFQPDAMPPIMDKSANNVLRYVGDDKWTVLSNEEVRANYTTDDLRFSIVYRARCFASEEERNRFHAQQPEDMMTLDSVLSTFRADLERRGILSAKQQVAPLDFALLLLKTYFQYPTAHDAVLPWNYCALDRLSPAWSWLTRLMC